MHQHRTSSPPVPHLFYLRSIQQPTHYPHLVRVFSFSDVIQNPLFLFIIEANRSAPLQHTSRAGTLHYQHRVNSRIAFSLRVIYIFFFAEALQTVLHSAELHLLVFHRSLDARGGRPDDPTVPTSVEMEEQIDAQLTVRELPVFDVLFDPMPDG